MSNADSVYSLFWVYRVAPEWLKLPPFERDVQREQFARTLAERDAQLTLRGAYSLAGLRHDADMILWLHGPDLAVAQDLAVSLRRTRLGAYLEATRVYTGIVPQSRYAPEHRPAFVKGYEPRTYLSMYPFVKTAEWYLLPFDQRRSLMAEHGRLGQPHSALPEVRIPVEAPSGAVAAPEKTALPTGQVLTNTINSFGLGDQEFVVAFESDDPAALVKMVEDLRAAAVRAYTAIDTPIFLGRRKSVEAVLADLG